VAAFPKAQSADTMSAVANPIWKRFRRHKMALVGLTVLIILCLMALFADQLSTHQFDSLDLDNMQSPPSLEHYFGTDDLGRDAFTRILHGGRVSLAIGIFSALVSASIGTTLGSLSGYYGGLIDTVIMRFTDIMFSIPILPLVIILSTVLKPTVPLLVGIIGCLGWMGTARTVRGSVLTIKNLDFIQAARSSGANDLRIIFKHALPNAIAPIIVSATLAVGGAIISESVLSFLGLGVRPPIPSWGNMLQGAQASMETKPWLAIFPGLFILITVLSVNFLGDGLRDALDPRMKNS
jgi:peptide/nickel transport system permease protein